MNKAGIFPSLFNTDHERPVFLPGSILVIHAVQSYVCK
jgi:hypothetical protein